MKILSPLQSKIDLGPAYIFIDPLRNIPEDQSRLLEEAVLNLGEKRPLKDQSFPPVELVIAKLLQKETNLSLEGHIPIVSVGGGSEAFRKLFHSAANIMGDKSYAIPIPSWNFWKIKDIPPTKFAFFEATNNEQLIEGFKRTCRTTEGTQDKVGALILSNPANPPLYRVDVPTAQALDEIAQQYGVQVILDEVARGSLMPGDRNSIGSKFTNPIIMEGMRKRLRESPFSTITYFLDMSERLGEIPVTPASQVYGKALEIMLEHSGPTTNKTLERRNSMLDTTLHTYSDGLVKTIRPSPSYLLSVLEFPKQIDTHAIGYALEMLGIHTMPLTMFYPEEMNITAPISHSGIRVCVGLEEEDRIGLVAKVIGQTVKKMSTVKK